MPNFECINLSKNFGAARALDGVSVKAEPGRVLGLLGPNGSGKTTMIKLPAACCSRREAGLKYAASLQAWRRKSWSATSRTAFACRNG